MSFKVTLLTLVDQQNTEDCVEGRGAIKKPRSQSTVQYQEGLLKIKMFKNHNYGSKLFLLKRKWRLIKISPPLNIATKLAVK